MFEKCGLRDVFSGFLRSKWIILAAILIFGCIGGVLYGSGLQKYNEANAKASQTVAAGYAYYYVSGSILEPIIENNEAKWYANSYVDLMRTVPSRDYIIAKLKENHTPEELIGLLDPDVYKNGVNRYNIWENSYKVERWSSNRILKITTVAYDKNTCKELMAACRSRLEEMAAELPDTTLTYEGEYFRNLTKGVISEDMVKPEKPSVKTLILMLIIGLVVGLFLSIFRSVFFPVLNRCADFELYGIRPIGEAGKKSIPLLARIIKKEAKDKKQIVFATSFKNSKKADELCRAMAEELKTAGMDVCLAGEENTDGKPVLLVAVSPDKDAAGSDLCEQADLLYTVEWKGHSLHSRFDEMIHYLELLNIAPAGAILAAK